MPGPASGLKRWDVYDALRREHMSKAMAAAIANKTARKHPRPLSKARLAADAAKRRAKR